MTNITDVESWGKLVAFLHTLDPVDWACRGQAREFGGAMLPRVDRSVVQQDLSSRLRLERGLCQRFREHAPNYLTDVERAYLETRWLQLVVMQHYGAPTRLLDWTKSPWVASYFAAFGEWDLDGYVFGFRRNVLEQHLRTKHQAELDGFAWGPHPDDVTFTDDVWDRARNNNRLFLQEYAESTSDWVATFYCREAHFPRLVAQQGLFTFASKPHADHWKYISETLPNDCFVVRIASTAKPFVIRHLNSIGLNGATLFPGADGVGRSLEGYARAWALEPKPSQF